ncbi:MAG: osmotically inducible protein C [Ponticaulis sp.]|nr:osmotically inducible protein C [Ponticaulis sp.]
MRSEKIRFPGHSGEELAARLERPAHTPKAYALFAHCFSCSKEVLAATRVSRRLVEHGIAVLRFDFTGLGASDGDFSNTNFTSNVEDLVAAADYLKSEFGRVDLLIGHSLGGAASIVAATRLPGVKAIATLGAPSDASHVLHQISTCDLETIHEDGHAEVSLAGRPFTIRKQFVEDVRGANVKEAAGQLKRPLLVMHAPLDEVVGIENATGLFVAAKHPKSFVSLDRADHLLTRQEDAEYAADMISAWAGRYLSAETEAAEAPPRPLEGYDVRVEETGTGNYANHVATASHLLRADEPEDHGGMNTGPSPFQYLSAALGACTTMTLRMYADRKDWPLDLARVNVSHKKVDHPDFPGKKLDVFERLISVKGDLTDEQRDRLLEIADKCPVHKTLHAGSAIESRLDEES